MVIYSKRWYGLKTVGIIAEYNPFHTGHRHHIETASRDLEADAVVAVMSGSFVQRGEPAVYDKWSRARSALCGGVDLVLELPAYFSLKSAEGFARGGVSILNSLGVIDYLSFGSEHGSLSELRSVSDLLDDEPPLFRESLNKNLKSGLSFASARERAIKAVNPHGYDIVKEPNNILAIEYLKAIKKTGSSIIPHTIKRAGAGYNSLVPENGFASATAIRKMLEDGADCSRFLPCPAHKKAVFMNDFEKLILYAVAATPKRALASVPDTGDGLLERLSGSCASSLEELLAKIKTRRLPLSRIKRVIMNILIGNDLPADLPPSYIRVLGFNDKGAALLKYAKRRALLPIISKPSAYKSDDPIWRLENRATDIYSLILGEKPGLNVKTAPVVI